MQDYHSVHEDNNMQDYSQEYLFKIITLFTRISRNNNMQDYHSVHKDNNMQDYHSVHKDNNMQDYHFVHKNI